MAQAAEADHTEYEGLYTDAVVSDTKPALAAEWEFPCIQPAPEQ